MKFNIVENTYLLEGARIQHAEDIIFWEGSAGAKRVIQALRSLQGQSHKAVSLKWDGSPAVIFGRNPQGEFIFTDKSGFTAKTYNGRATSGKALQDILLSRSGGRNADNPKYQAFAIKMRHAFEEFEKAIPENYIGYFKGDMLYFNTPELIDGKYSFTPQLVTYEVDSDSELGKKVGASNVGVVIHRQVTEDGEEYELTDLDIFQGSSLLVMPPVYAEKPVKIQSNILDKLESIVNKNSSKIDELLNPETLRGLQLTDFPQVLYTYINSKVDTGMQGLGVDFPQWLSTSRVSGRKQERILEYISQHQQAYKVLWETVSSIIKVKDYIIQQFDKQDTDVKQHIAGDAGGEGYVMAHPEGDIKLVGREFFSRANRAVQR